MKRSPTEDRCLNCCAADELIAATRPFVVERRRGAARASSRIVARAVIVARCVGCEPLFQRDGGGGALRRARPSVGTRIAMLQTEIFENL